MMKSNSPFILGACVHLNWSESILPHVISLNLLNPLYSFVQLRSQISLTNEIAVFPNETSMALWPGKKSVF